MAKLIKKGSVELGDISPDNGFAEPTAANKRVIPGLKFEAKAEAREILTQAEEQAQQIVAQAQAQAQQYLAQTQQQAKQMLEQARAQGLQEGRQQGAAQLAEVIAQSSKRMQQIEAQVVPQLSQLALSIARKIIGSHLQAVPEAVADIVKQALAEKARQRREIFLRVNPADMAVIRKHKADLLEVLSRCKEIAIREDPEVARYGAIIETDAGIIDAQLETQLAVFERVLKDQ
jgi:flagellar biosynthesis/type III secretory pathway protein FliH